MIRFIQDFRLVPVVLVATTAFFAVKVIGLIFYGGLSSAESFTEKSTDIARAMPATTSSSAKSMPASQLSKQSWAQEMFNYPSATGSSNAEKKSEPVVRFIDRLDLNQPDPIITGMSAAEKKTDQNAGQNPAAKNDTGAPPNTKPAEPKPSPNGTPVNIGNSNEWQPPSPSERALLEHLQGRRQELEARMRELDIRENLLKATEKRIEARIKELEESFGGNPQKKKEEAEAALSKNLKSLVVMYENMKAKDAAKIFDRLELGLLAMIANQINPRRMSDILAQMSPEVAERLTVELANKATGSSKGGVASGLPKIEGRPDGPPDGT